MITWTGLALGFFLGCVFGAAAFFVLAMFTTVARDQLWHEAEVEKHKARQRKVAEILDNNPPNEKQPSFEI